MRTRQPKVVSTKQSSFHRTVEELRTRLFNPFNDRFTAQSMVETMKNQGHSPMANDQTKQGRKRTNEESKSNGSEKKSRKSTENVSKDAKPKSPYLKRQSYTHLSLVNPQDCVALDCEFVGVGPNGNRHALARCSVVDYHGNCVLDVYSKPDEKVTDYRYRYSGIRPFHLYSASRFDKVQAEVKAAISGKILIGHAIWNDLNVLEIEHPLGDVRDTLRHPWIKQQTESKMNLKFLAKKLLDLDIQIGRHCSVEDAKATMELFKLAERSMDRLSSATERKRTESNHSFFEDHYWPDNDSDSECDKGPKRNDSANSKDSTGTSKDAKK